MLQNF